MTLDLFREQYSPQCLRRVVIALQLHRRRNYIRLRDLEFLHRLDQSERRNVQVVDRGAVISLVESRDPAPVEILVKRVAGRAVCYGSGQHDHHDPYNDLPQNRPPAIAYSVRFTNGGAGLRNSCCVGTDARF